MKWRHAPAGPDAPPGVLRTLRETPLSAHVVLIGIFINQVGAFVQLFLVLFLTARGFTVEQAGFALGCYSVGAIAGTFGGDDLRFEFHLAPPLLARRDKETGLPRKMSFGPWLLPVFRVLAKLKFLRGSALDPFGRSLERRTERALIGEYETMIDEVLARLTPDNHHLAVGLAAIPEKIRGFGHVKQRHLAAAKADEAALLEQFRAGAPALPTRAAPGLATSGAVSHPIASPAAAATTASTRFSASSTTAIVSGEPPTALSSPTRRVRSAIRPPASTVTHPIASSAVSHAPGARTCCSACTGTPAPVWMACHGIRTGESDPEPYLLAKAGAAAGSLSFRFRK